jgi:FAD/FMN-containing dehydrogenase/Fe-S oxidoreductase
MVQTSIRHLEVLGQPARAPRLARLADDDRRSALAAEAAASLEQALRRDLEGEVCFDAATRALYATDGSNYRQAPIGVVQPRHGDDVEAAVRLARAHGAPILSRGAGTSLAGQCCNVALVIDHSRYRRRVRAIDAESRLARVDPGCVLDDLRAAAKAEAGLTFGPDPATHDHCTLGGMLGNNSCGSHSLLSQQHGLGLRTSDNTRSLDVLLYDGTRLSVGPTTPEHFDAILRAGGRRAEIYRGLRALTERYGNAIRERYPRLGRRVSGYNLDELLPENGCNVARALVGSEATLVTILEAELHLVPEPGARSVVMLGFDDIYVATECALEVLGFGPTACEGLDDRLFSYVRQKGDQNANLAILPAGRAFILAEFAGDTRAESDEKARRMMAHVRGLGARAPVDMKLYDDPVHEQMIWSVREGGLGSTAWVPGHADTWPGWEDSAVPVEATPAYLRELGALFDRYGYEPALYGHLGQGCVHCRVEFDLYSMPGIEKYRRFLDEAVDLVVRFGGVASGEHGDGQARARLLPRIYGEELMGAFRELKRIFDPDDRMNPGKLVSAHGDAYAPNENLRIGPDYEPPATSTHFAFPGDRHDFARAALRCVGVGTCLREDKGTMCPSYRVTREERHSTRGRAHLLFEMLNGELITDGFRSNEVKEALDLCLGCKGCKSDCPVGVDMATYKAEFLSHHYAGRIRPRHAYAFGLIHEWARVASPAPSLVNLATSLPGTRALAKWLAGVHPERSIPPFAPERFKRWFAARPRVNAGRPKVLLFPDTFNDFFTPDVAVAATEVLEDAGFEVLVPRADVCCGRPLYDYGFLGLARRRFERLLATLRPHYRAGVPLVVLEPSCWAALKDELANMLPNDEDAKRLASVTFTLADFLRSHAPRYRLPRFERRALVHGHCHQQALDAVNDKEFGKLFAEKAVLGALGIEQRHPDSGCCGMAGAFGYERAGAHYDVSVACAERVLLPEVRGAAENELVIADGFSCRGQIEQLSGRSALHLAQVLRLAVAERDEGRILTAGPPEAGMVAARRRARRRGMLKSAAWLGAGTLALAAVVAFRRRGLALSSRR